MLGLLCHSTAIHQLHGVAEGQWKGKRWHTSFDHRNQCFLLSMLNAHYKQFKQDINSRNRMSSYAGPDTNGNNSAWTSKKLHHSYIWAAFCIAADLQAEQENAGQSRNEGAP
eukprot:1088449-Pelagomonas_calceolata.AAC.2